VRIKAAAAVCVLVLGGCGGGGKTEGAGTTAPSKHGEKAIAAPADLAKVAKTGCEKVSSGRVEMRVAFSGGDLPKPVEGVITGEFDDKARRVHVVWDMGAMVEALGGAEAAGAGAAQARLEFVVDGDTFYIKSPFFAAPGGGAKPWVKSAAGESGGLTDEALFGASMCDITQVLTGVTGVRKVGTDPVEGTSTVHYVADVDIKRAVAAAASKNAREFAQSLIDASGLSEVQVDLWVDGGGIVRKMAFEMPNFDVGGLVAGAGPGEAAGESAPSSKVSAKFTILFRDLNKPVLIDIPPPDQVTDLGSMLGGSMPAVPKG